MLTCGPLRLTKQSVCQEAIKEVARGVADRDVFAVGYAFFFSSFADASSPGG